MKKLLIMLQVLVLIFVIMPATANAQSKPDVDLEKLMDKLKKAIDEKLDDLKKKFKEELKELLEKYLDEGKEQPAKPEKKIDFWLGITAQDTEDNSGILVTNVAEGSPAAKAGIKEGDKLTSFGKHVIKNLDGFKSILPNFKAGMRVGIGLKRGDQIIIATITLEARKESETPKKPVGSPYIGLSVMQSNAGVVVRGFSRNSPASKVGILAGDVIFSLAGKEVKTIADFQKIMSTLKPGEVVTIVVVRHSKKLELKITIGTAPVIPAKPVKPTPGKPAFMGVMIQEIEGKIFVTEVVENGPAAKAKIKVGDQIYAVNSKVIKSLDALKSELLKYKAGQTVNLIVVRNSQRIIIKLTFGARPGETPEKPKVYEKAYLGFSATVKEDGVYITKLAEKSPAFQAGFVVGDKLHYFGEVKIKTIEDISKALEKYHAGQEVGCVVYRGEERVILEFKLVTKEQWQKDLESNKKFTPNENGIWLGLSAVNAEEGDGIVVTKVALYGPADRIGLLPDDKIITFNKVAIASMADLRSVITELSIGSKIAVEYKRGKVQNVGFITIMSKKQAQALKPITRRRAWIGISLDTTYKGEGIKIAVKEDSAAEQIGLKEDDVILSINGQSIKDRMHFAEIWKKVKPGTVLKLEVLRGEQKLEFVIPTFMQPNHEDIPMPERPKTPEGWNLPQLPGGMSPEQYYAVGNLSRLAIEAMQTADYDEAIRYLKKVLEIAPNNFNAFYNLACIYSLQNKKEEGLVYLKKAIGTGFIDWEHIKTDTDLDNLRDMPAYKEMMSDKKSLLKMVADMKVKEIKAAYGEKFNFYVDVDNMMIIATEHPKEILEDLKIKLVKYAEAQWKLLFDNKPDYFITFIVPTPLTFNKIVNNPMVGGFYNHSTRSLIAKELGQSLVHEFTHALHYGDLAKTKVRQNIWFIEALATCFENSVMKDGVPTPVHNGRLGYLQALIKRKIKLPTLSEFMARDRNTYLEDAGISYTMSRYIAYWLWEQGLLKKYYDLYTKMLPKDVNGIKAMETLFGKSIDEIEKDWYKWVNGLPDYMSFTTSSRPFIGIKPSEAAGGIKIDEVIENTPAFKCGFKKDDVITHIDGERIISLNGLRNTLYSHKPGDEIEITFIRNGEKMSIKLKLITIPQEGQTQTQPNDKKEPEKEPEKVPGK